MFFDNIIFNLFISFFIGYFPGSIPFGYIITMITKGHDLRKIGSGNIGTTNVLRIGNKNLAILTLFLDTTKGAIPIIITSYFFSDSTSLCLITGLGSVIGHIFPIWLNFNGGKGVATTFGILIILSWKIALLSLLIWVFVALIFNYSSLASIITSLSIPILSWYLENTNLFILSIILSILIIFSHKENLIRLFNKKETKIGQKSTKIKN